MRTLVLLLLAFMAFPVAAQDWPHYQNGRFGFTIDLPPQFNGRSESDNGDGQVFVSDNGRESLRVWGGNIIAADFSAETTEAIARAKSDGIKITYEATTPSWASYSGTKSGNIVYVRMIALCEGTQYAAFELQYPKQDMPKFDMIVDKLVKSLDGPRFC